MKDLKNPDPIRSGCIRSSVRALLQNQRYLLGPLLFGLCVTAYSQSGTALSPKEADRCEDPGAALLHTVEVSAGGPYTAKVGVPITLHGTYTVAGQTQNSQQLKLIGQALQGYLQEHGAYPPGTFLNRHGEPTVSWRVLLLPYLGEQELYERFDLQKSWTDPVNLRLLREMPAVYRKSDAFEHTTETGFAAIQGKEALFNQASAQLNGGQSPQGISAVEKVAVGPVGSDVHLPWTAPGDIPVERATVLGSRHAFSGEGDSFTPLLFLNGSVRLVPDNIDAGAMINWTRIMPMMAGSQMGCACTPPSSLDAGFHASWNLGQNAELNTAGFDVTFLAKHAGTYHVTLKVFDRYGNEYNSQAKVEVR